MNNIVIAILVLGIMGGVFGLVLAIASKVFAVTKDPREEEIWAIWPAPTAAAAALPAAPPAPPPSWRATRR
jgi:electron transport complex protein RnfB